MRSRVSALSTSTPVGLPAAVMISPPSMRVAAVIPDCLRAIWLQTTAWPSMRDSTMAFWLKASSSTELGHSPRVQSFWSQPRPRTTATSGWSARYWRTRSTHSAQLRVPTKSTVSRACPRAIKCAWASTNPGYTKVPVKSVVSLARGSASLAGISSAIRPSRRAKCRFTKEMASPSNCATLALVSTWSYSGVERHPTKAAAKNAAKRGKEACFTATR